MGISREWPWETLSSSIWTQPSEECYFYAHKWRAENRKSILDLGCGLGRHSIFFAKHGFKVTAVDLSQCSIDYLKKWQKNEQVDILTEKADMNRLPFSDNAFDCVWAYHVISHTDSKGIAEVIREVKRVLKPGGVFYFTLCAKDSPLFADPSLPRADSNTILKTANPEKGIPHYYADLADIKELLVDFTVSRIRHVEDCSFEQDHSRSKHYYIDAAVNKSAVELDYSSIIGRDVVCKIDRPLGAAHPRFPEMIYPVNYGYVEHVIAGDGAEQDIYLMGIDEPVEEFEGRVIAVVHRYNDIEDKWIVAPKGMDFTDAEILERVHFQERFFDTRLYR